MEETEKRNDENYLMLFREAVEAIFVLDGGGAFLDVNAAGCALFGYSREEILHLGVRDLAVSDELTDSTLRLDNLADGERTTQRRRLRRKDGSVFIGEIGGKRMADGHLQGTIRDVTDRVRVEEALRDSEAHYRAIVELPFAQICRWKPDTTLTYVNDAYAKAYGSTPQALVGTPWIRFVPEEARASVIQNYVELMAAPRINTYEHQVVEADGSTRWIFWTDYPIVADDGQVVEFQSLGQDITERRLTEQRLHMLSRAIDQGPASIVITTAAGVIEYVNPKFEQVTGYAAEEVIGTTLKLINSGGTLDEDYERTWTLISSGQEWRGVSQSVRKNGEMFWEDATISPVFDDTGKIAHFLAIKEDVTATRAAEAALRKLTEELEARVEERTTELQIVNAALEQAARAKDEFLASMSHELRSPLSGILGASEGLQAEVYGPINERQRRALHSIDVSGQHLLGLINDILDVAKVEAGQVTLQLDPVSAGDVCQASLQLVRGLAAKKRQRLSFSMEPTEIGMLADVRRLKQVLVNLLSNAIKFTADYGRIGLQVEGDEIAGLVRFTVWDTGIGISNQDLARLFLPFTQLDSSLSREHTGTGLGLALVRRMVELHGGGVHVESTVGAGSRFTAVVPWRSPRSEPPLPEEPEVVGGGEHPTVMGHFAVLLADDSEQTVEVIGDYLRSAGCKVIIARRGTEAVRMAETMHPDVIIMDIQMPGMDGLTAIKRLRTSNDAIVARIPVIAVTALAMPGDRERCLEAGANEYMSKPVPLGKLLAQIVGLVQAPVSQGAH